MTMLQAMIFLYLTVFVSFQIGQRIAMTNIRTHHFIMIMVGIKLLLNSYT